MITDVRRTPLGQPPLYSAPRGEIMAKAPDLKFDEIGLWSEIKLAILKEYANAYSKILASQRYLKHLYIDAFAGAGVHFSKRKGEMVPGSPLNALAVTPKFEEYHLIDLDVAKVAHLRELIGDRADVHVHEGNCNEVLLQRVFPRARFEDYRRALCLLDPYGLHLDWRVLATAGSMKSVEVFLNFPIEDMNRNALWRQPERVGEDGQRRMTLFWGDESWRQAAYAETENLFGDVDMVKRLGNEPIVKAFQERLRNVAGFRYVPEPIPMRNGKGAVVYYLFFASHNAAGEKIAKSIFKKYRMKGLH
jgi:three-Cys-motif partner protein